MSLSASNGSCLMWLWKGNCKLLNEDAVAENESEKKTEKTEKRRENWL